MATRREEGDGEFLLGKMGMRSAPNKSAFLNIFLFSFLFKKILKILRIPLNIVKKVIKRLKSGLFRVKLLLRTKLMGRIIGERSRRSNKGESDEKKKKRRQKKPGKSTNQSE